MVKGTGIDLVAIQRIEKCITTFGDRFLNKIFTEAEIGWCKSRACPAVHFAGRWAAKEAFFKAIPLSCQSAVSWKSVQILSLKGSGGPVIEICSRELKERLSRESIVSLHVSISHDEAFCIAFVLAD
jgi:holo-[acyl-carrier protein] synthase